ncbi:hypothetical protein ACFRCG_33635 [Embleya sp. NPDC056575]|uniref:hypothetical protein n=1 Tax=unclassified Embleya TaxID=2699296 RepID=UPI0036AD62D7
MFQIDSFVADVVAEAIDDQDVGEQNAVVAERNELVRKDVRPRRRGLPLPGSRGLRRGGAELTGVAYRHKPTTPNALTGPGDWKPSPRSLPSGT